MTPVLQPGTFDKEAAVQGSAALSGILRQTAGDPEARTVTESDLIPFHDYPALRRQMFDKVMASVVNTPAVKNAKYTLQVKDVEYKDPDTISMADRRRAVVEGRTLSRRLTGRYELLDNATGKVVNSTNRKTLINVPFLTDDGTYIRNGITYAIPKQLRMRPGVYTHFTADDYPEAQFNIKSGTGMGFRLYMDPESSVFYLTSGGRKAALYPILKSIGVKDQDIETTWGKDIFARNRQEASSPHAARWINDMTAKLTARARPSETAPAYPENKEVLQPEETNTGDSDESETSKSGGEVGGNDQ